MLEQSNKKAQNLEPINRKSEYSRVFTANHLGTMGRVGGGRG
jgi:hypothetical protein